MFLCCSARMTLISRMTETGNWATARGGGVSGPAARLPLAEGTPPRGHSRTPSLWLSITTILRATNSPVRASLARNTSLARGHATPG